MKAYRIEGGKRLEGEVSISGSKNAALPIIAATILNDGITKLYNIPQIHDIKITLEILNYLGCKIKQNKKYIEIDSTNINKMEIPEELMIKMRSSVIIAGALAGRFKKATFSYPGGCDIGARPIDLHLKSFKKLGINIEEGAGFIICKCDTIIGAKINLDFPSVGATENIILASVFCKGKTTIANAAKEPEIVDLCNFLNEMGAHIKGIGSDVIEIIGVKKLKSISYRIIPDRIEAATLLCAGAITGGNIIIKDVIPKHLSLAVSKLEEIGCEIRLYENAIALEASKRLKATEINTMPYPGFPTDMQSIFGSVLAVSKGTSIITETIFENRFKYLYELKKMGAKIKVQDKTAIITGVRKLNGSKVASTDLRGGAALVLAGLGANGITTVTNIDYILRGYEYLDKKLRKLNAKIEMDDF